MNTDRSNVPEWNHFPFLGYLHYTSIVRKYIKPQRTILPPLNPYIGNFNHSVVTKKEVAVQTDPDKAMELGQQIIDNLNYDI